MALGGKRVRGVSQVHLLPSHIRMRRSSLKSRPPKRRGKTRKKERQCKTNFDPLYVPMDESEGVIIETTEKGEKKEEREERVLGPKLSL